MLRSRDLSSGDSLFGSWNTFLCMTFLMCVYECKEHILCKSACEGACVSACLRQQFRAAQSMLGSLSLQIRQGEITQVHRGENPPSPILYLSVSLSLLLPHSLLFFSYWLVHSTSLLQYYISFMNALSWSKWRIKCETHPDSSPGSFTKQVSTFIVSVCSFVSMIELYLLGSLSARMSSFHTKIKWHVISGKPNNPY